MKLSFLHQKKEVGIQVMYNLATAGHSNYFFVDCQWNELVWP